MKKRYLYLLLFISVVAFFGPLIYYWYKFHDYGVSSSTSSWGTFGDFFGGVTNAMFGLIGVIFLYFTFKEQRDVSRIEKFEEKYYQLINLHRDNVTELQVKEEVGKKVFLLVIREIRAALPIVKELHNKYCLNLQKDEFIGLVYMAIFYGVGPNSTRVLKSSLGRYPENFLIELNIVLQRMKLPIKRTKKFNYVPFEGHQSRLAHYYRHLFQTIDFVDTTSFLSDEQKKSYVKTIRAQLSNHEQALLFFNSLSELGRSWKQKGLISKYELIKNLPKDFIDPVNEIDVKTVYPDIKFEWEENHTTSCINQKVSNINFFSFNITITSPRRQG